MYLSYAIFQQNSNFVLFLCFVWLYTLVLRNFDSAIFFIATKTIKKIYKLEKKMLSQLVLNWDWWRKYLTSVAPWESCWLTSSPCLISSWMSPSILLSVDARVSLIISWVMPVNQIHKQNHRANHKGVFWQHADRASLLLLWGTWRDRGAALIYFKKWML